MIEQILCTAAVTVVVCTLPTLPGCKNLTAPANGGECRFGFNSTRRHRVLVILKSTQSNSNSRVVFFSCSKAQSSGFRLSVLLVIQL